MIKHAVEIGAGDCASSQVLKDEALRYAPRVELYEPNILLYRRLPSRYEIKSFKAAVVPTEVPGDRALLVHMGYASYLVGQPSFLRTSCEPEAEQHWAPLTLSVPVVTMAEVDDGTIDYLVLTPGYGEAELLDQMRSRPAEIRTKTYAHNARQWDEAHRMFGVLNSMGYRPEVLEHNQHRTYFSLSWRRAS